MDEINAPVGTAYDTTDNKPETIGANGQTYVLVPEKTKGSETGDVVEGLTEVTYVYKVKEEPEEKVGSVIIYYVDEDGNELQTPVTDEKDVPVGTEYDTTDYKPEKIYVGDKTYVLVPEKTEGSETGEVVEGTTEVVYVYRLEEPPVLPETPEKTGSVIVNYKDEDGNILIDPVTDENDVPVGNPYDTTDQRKPEITIGDKTYVLVPEKTEGSETGEVTEGTTEVTYIYKLKEDPQKTGSVTVRYVDEDGNEIKEVVKVKENEPEGTEYDTTPNREEQIVTPDGKIYILVPEKTTGSETGTVKEGDTEVVYVYKLKEEPKEKTGTIVVNYKDEEGNVLIDPVTDEDNVPVGNPYDTTDQRKPEITVGDKTYVLVPEKTVGSETGEVAEGTTQVTYVYKLKEAPEKTGSVTVRYIDEDGNEIKEVVKVKDNEPEGTDYDTTRNREERIVTQDGKIYVLVPEKTKGSETGKVTEGDTEVTYVYKQVQAPLTVNYVDENGNKIEVSVSKDFPVGDEYSSEGYKKVLIVKDGKMYELIRTEGSETGTMGENGAEVTYVFREVKSTTTTTTPKKTTTTTNTTNNVKSVSSVKTGAASGMLEAGSGLVGALGAILAMLKKRRSGK
jgi:hypothetical protein